MNYLYFLLMPALLFFPSKGRTDTNELAKIVSFLNGLSTTRESLAATLDPRIEPITHATFLRVCAPVGKSLMSWAKGHGYRARQVASKSRNPSNSATYNEVLLMQRFRDDRSLVIISEAKDTESTLYVPIWTARSCLHCHGEKSSRPDFIKDTYPADQAFDFSPGDLRGMYTVSIPNATSSPSLPPQRP